MMAFYERQAGDRKYIDNDVELITKDGLQVWTTNLYDLSADIYEEGRNNEKMVSGCNGRSYLCLPL
jgi:hypothetical protein